MTPEEMQNCRESFAANPDFQRQLDDVLSDPRVEKMEPGRLEDCQRKGFSKLAAERDERRRFGGTLVTPDGARDAQMRQFTITENDRIMAMYRDFWARSCVLLSFIVLGIGLILVGLNLLLSKI